MKWTNDSIGTAALKEEKLKIAHQTYSLYWKDATSLERCSFMSKDSKNIMINAGEYKGEWVWDVIAKRFKYE
eukprot:6793349-Pyramimonas_sp.AAC.1